MEPPDEQAARLADGLGRLAAGDASARDDLIDIACDRMRGIAHRMLRRFPTVRRWDDTDDVVQAAAVKLLRALNAVSPRDPCDFIGLAAVQIRRTLLDLSKKHAGPASYASNHETNVLQRDGASHARIDEIGCASAAGELDRWTRFHEAADALPEEERELFHLVWYLGLTQPEAARLLGCSERTVRRRWDSLKSLIGTAMADERPE